MMKILTTLLIVTAIIILFLLVSKYGVAEYEKAECYKWIEYSQQYDDYYWTDWQIQQCEYYNIPIK